MSCTSREGFPRRRHYFVLALAFTLAVAVNALAPLDYQPLDWQEAVQRFRQIPLFSLDMQGYGAWDRYALPFLALGFLWLAAWATDRKSWILRVLAAVGVVLACSLFAVTLALAQFWFPPQSVSQNDLAAEALGGLVGVVLWLIVGQPLTQGLCSLAAARWNRQQAAWLREMEKQREAIRHAQQAAREEFDRQRAALEESTAELNALREKQEREQAESSTQQATRESQLRERMAELAAQEATLAEHRLALDQQQRDLEARSAQLQADRQQLEAECAALASERENAIREQQEARQQADRERLLLGELHATAEREQAALQAAQAAFESRTAEWAKQEDAAAEQRAQFARERRELEEDRAQVQAALEQLEAERVAFERHHAAITAAQHGVQQQLERERAALQQFRSDLERRGRALEQRQAALSRQSRPHDQQHGQFRSAPPEQRPKESQEAELPHDMADGKNQRQRAAQLDSELKDLRRELRRGPAVGETGEPVAKAGAGAGDSPAQDSALSEPPNGDGAAEPAGDLDLRYDEVVTRLSETLQKKSWWQHLRSHFGSPQPPEE